LNPWERHKREEGKIAQERVACDLEQFFPNATIYSNDCYGVDIVISNSQIYLRGEVKSALELYYGKIKNKETKELIKKYPRRGYFCINERDLRADFYCFVVKFVDIPGIWNGDYETFYANKEDVESFVEPRLNDWGDYHFHISYLPKINATLDFTKLKIYSEKLEKTQSRGIKNNV